MEFKKMTTQGEIRIGPCGDMYIQIDKVDMQIEYLTGLMKKTLSEGDKLKITIEKIKE